MNKLGEKISNILHRGNALLVIFLTIALLPFQAFSQEKTSHSNEKAWIQGYVSDANGQGIPVVAVGVINMPKPIGTATDEKGHYRLQVPANTLLKLSFSHTSYHSIQQEIWLSPGENRSIDIEMQEAAVQMEEVKIEGSRERGPGYVSISPWKPRTCPASPVAWRVC